MKYENFKPLNDDSKKWNNWIFRISNSDSLNEKGFFAIYFSENYFDLHLRFDAEAFKEVNQITIDEFKQKYM